MLCPHCTTERLVMADRQGIEIDYCPNCRGVWLDRGELDKLIERASASTWASPTAAPSPVPMAASQPISTPRLESRRDDDRRWRDDDDTPPHGYGQKKKKKSFLSEILDF
jgi:uncharacterized protein